MKNDSRSRRIFNLSLALTVVLAFLLGFQSAGLVRLLSRHEKLPDWATRFAWSLSHDLQASPPGFSESELGVFYDVLSYISQAYLYHDEIDGNEIIHGASAGAIAALGDRYSRFIPPADQQVLSEEIEGEYAGVGIAIIDRSGVLPPWALECEIAGGGDPEDPSFMLELTGVVVVRVFEAGPAYETGLLADDVITCVDDNLLRGHVVEDAVALIKGPPDTVVQITVWRPSTQEELSFEITRQVVEVPTVGAVEMLDDQIGYIRLDSFNNLTPRDVAEAIDELLDQGMQGLIFDLRNNTGGPLEASVSVADLFVSDGDMVHYEDYQGHRQSFPSADGGLALNLPLVVLVNGNTASASEIVAGAVRDTRTGLLVGEPTYGKGVVQNVYILRDGSGLVLTTGRYLTPNGHEITREGMEPDVLSELDPDRLRALDPQIDAFLNHMDAINEEFRELRAQMTEYLQEHDFQRGTAVQVISEWIQSGKMPHIDEPANTTNAVSEVDSEE